MYTDYELISIKQVSMNANKLIFIESVCIFTDDTLFPLLL
jgi:hypothetical protein